MQIWALQVLEHGVRVGGEDLADISAYLLGAQAALPAGVPGAYRQHSFNAFTVAPARPRQQSQYSVQRL